MDELIFAHKVDKSFLKYGMVITQKYLNEHRDLIVKAYEKSLDVFVVFEGKTYNATIDHGDGRDNLYRLMFSASLNQAFCNKFSTEYTTVKDSKGRDDISIVDGSNMIVGFYLTKDDYTFEARIMDSSKIVDPKRMKKLYKEYLTSLDGAFSGYVEAIDKPFVKETAEKLYKVKSAYEIFDEKKILELVEHIRSDKDLDEKDKASSSRCPSCSLKKYASFLKIYIKHTTKKPFEIPTVIDTISKTGLIFDPMFVKRYLCALLTKPFVILSGLTGSGKTQLALAFPKLICKDKSQYRMIPVGADWTNRENLLGYPNALRPDEYVMPDNGALELILEASKPENADKPYFLILDEMNMSYVERYFADFLSAMESGETIPLWAGSDKVPASVTLPPNLFIVGTINVDETTYMFSPKVLDRANVIEFRIKKGQMEKYLNGSGTLSPIENCSEQAASFIEIALKDHVSPLSDEMKKTLVDTFETLGKIQKEFGYRTAHEMSRFISIAKNCTDMSDMEALDSAMVQKLLPKIHGSRKKVTPVLKALWNICYASTPVEIDALPELPDLNVFNYPLTAEKVWRMFQIAQDNGFTSFAEA